MKKLQTLLVTFASVLSLASCEQSSDEIKQANVIPTGRYIATDCVNDVIGEEVHYAEAGELQADGTGFVFTRFEIKCDLDKNGRYVPANRFMNISGSLEPRNEKITLEGDKFKMSGGPMLYHFSSDGEKMYTHATESQMKKYTKILETRKNSLNEEQKTFIAGILSPDGILSMVRVNPSDDKLSQVFMHVENMMSK